jgi:hypothetical protein
VWQLRADSCASKMVLLAQLSAQNNLIEKSP